MKQLKQIAKEKDIRFDSTYYQIWKSPDKEDYIEDLCKSRKVTISGIKDILIEKAKGKQPEAKKIKRKRWSRAIEKMIYDKYDHRCAICERQIEFRDGELDHIKSLGSGGSDTIENLQWLCRSCNGLKGSKLTNAQVKRSLKKASTQKATRTTRKEK